MRFAQATELESKTRHTTHTHTKEILVSPKMQNVIFEAGGKG